MTSEIPSTNAETVPEKVVIPEKPDLATLHDYNDGFIPEIGGLYH